MLFVKYLGSSVDTYVGIIVLCIIIGGINAVIAGGLDAITPLRIQAIIPRRLRGVLNWRFWFTMKRSIFRVFFQGLILVILIIVINFLFVTLANIVTPGPYTYIPSIIITSYLDGYLFKSAAGGFRGIED